MLLGSTFDPILFWESEEDSDELFFLSSNPSFEFTVTSPMEMSTLLITIPTSLHPKEEEKWQLKKPKRMKIKKKKKERKRLSKSIVIFTLNKEKSNITIR